MSHFCSILISINFLIKVAYYVRRPYNLFFFYFLEDMSPFCGGHWYPYFGLLVTSPLGFKARVGSPLFELSGGVRVTLHTFPEIYLWCNTCQPLGGQHGSQTVSSIYLQDIGGTQNQKLSCRCSQCEIRQARRSTDWAILARLTTVQFCPFVLILYDVLLLQRTPKFHAKQPVKRQSASDQSHRNSCRAWLYVWIFLFFYSKSMSKMFERRFRTFEYQPQY